MKNSKLLSIYKIKFCILIGWMLFFQSTCSDAQLCSGSLGDPIANVTFGQDAFVSNGTISFEYVGGCPDKKGQYTISNFLFGCGDHTWLPAIGDHTGDHDGNYLLINAESTPGTIYRDTATGLCGNTTYQFSAWITNIMQTLTCGGNAVLPNITFTISNATGTVLTTFNTGNLPILDSKVWNQYGLSFTTPPDVSSLILTLSINPMYGCGSAFAVDDITFSLCGPLVTATIDGTPGPANVCAGYNNPFILHASYNSGFTDPAVQWQSSLDSGITWDNIEGATTTTYAVPRRDTGRVVYRIVVAERANINSKNCRVSSNFIYTDVYPQPAHNPPVNIIGCINKTLNLPQADPTELQVLWSGPNGYSSDQPKAVISDVQYADTGLYKLKQTFYFGCTSVDSFYLKVFPSTTITVSPIYSICQGASKTLSASSSGGGSIKWTPAVGLSNDTIANPVASPTDSIQYKVVVTNSFGCKDSATVNLNVYKNPTVSAGPDEVIVSGDSVTLNGSVTGTAVNYNWSPASFINNTQLVHPTVYPPEDISYKLTAVSTVGCGTVSDDINIKVYKDIFIPNSFTPNGDGINDKFEILAFSNYKLINFSIYNRWGQLLFKTSGTYNSWDGYYHGLIQPVGIYVYYLEMENPKGKRISKKGTIMLLQ